MNSDSLSAGFHTVDFVILVMYLLSMVALGIWFAREQQTEEDYFHGGGRMNWLLVGLSMLATGFSGISFVGIVGFVFKNDARLFVLTVINILLIPVVLFLIPVIYKRMKGISIYEFVEERFNVPLRIIASVLFMLNKFFWMSVAFLAASIVLCQAIGLSMSMVLAVVGISVTILTMFGGMKGVVWTDAIQALIVIGGIVFIFIALLNPSGGSLHEIWGYASQAGKTKLYDFTMDLSQPGVFICFLSTLALFFGATPSDQVMIQRVVSTGSSREAAKSYTLSIVSAMLLVALVYGIAILLYGYYGTGVGELPQEVAEHPDKILPFFILSKLPVGIRGLLIAAITAATASTATSILNSLSAVTMGDFVDKFARKPISQKQRVFISRIITAVWGILSVGFAIGMYNFPVLGVIGEATPKLAGLAGSALGGIFILGLFTKRTNSAGVFIGAVAGTALVAYLTFYSKIFHFLWFFPIGMFTTMLIGYFSSLLINHLGTSTEDSALERNKLGNSDVSVR